MDEIWKPVPYELYSAAYSVSNTGRVKPNVISRYSKNKTEFMTGCLSPRGYLHVSLTGTGSQQRSCFIHRMVALAFLGPPPFPSAIVCHNNSCKTDNRAENLRWGTHKSNAADREAAGHTRRGETSGMSKLTEHDVRTIRALYAEGGITQWELARRFNVYQTVISRVVLRKLWTHV